MWTLAHFDNLESIHKLVMYLWDNKVKFIEDTPIVVDCFSYADSYQAFGLGIDKEGNPYIPANTYVRVSTGINSYGKDGLTLTIDNHGYFELKELKNVTVEINVRDADFGIDIVNGTMQITNKQPISKNSIYWKELQNICKRNGITLEEL